jgi:hypothetical protein
MSDFLGKLVIMLFIYIVSVMSMYTWIKIAHSKGGYAEGTPVGTRSIMLTFLPLANTIASIMGWLFFYPAGSKDRERSLEEFFEIRK